MKANLSMSQVWWNKSLLSYFFREQSVETMQDLLNRAKNDWDSVLRSIDEQTEDEELDEIEESFYEESVEELAERFYIELEEDNED